MRPDQPEPAAAAGAPGDGGRHPGAAGPADRLAPQAAGEDGNRNRGPDAAEPPSRPRRPDAVESSSREGPADDAATPSRAEQLAEHGRYRDVVAGGERTAADRSPWADALPGLRAAWEEHKERYPERARAMPRTEPDGSWTSGEHRRLDPEQNTEAAKAHADLADEASRYILPALRRIEAADPARKLAGLDHMIKGEDRLKEKLADAWQARPGLSAAQVLSLVPDAVRSTLTYSPERYAEGVLADIGRLKAEGFELMKLKNLWHADQYRGINSQWYSSETGTRFEMQFHTPESLEAKELTHQAYERIRASTVLPAEEQDLTEESDLENFQRRVNDCVDVPTGTDRIKDFPEERND